MPRRALPRLLALVLLAGACACRDESAPAAPLVVPLPANLGELDGRVVDRIRAAETALRARPADAQAWADLGMTYGSERLRALALECFERAVELDPRQPRWPYRQGITLAQLGRMPEAAQAFQRSIALEPSYPPSHARLGNLHLEQGELEAAEQAYRRATELDSSYPGGWVGLARVFLQRDQNDEALAILERLRKEDPEDRTFRQLLGVAQHQAGLAPELPREEVVADEDIPVWNDPWELEARRFRQTPTLLVAGQALEAGQGEEALRLIEEARAQGADVGETALQAAGAYLSLGRLDDALREVTTLLEREPDNTSALLVRAQVHDKQGDRKGAVAELERVVALQPTYAGAFVALGRMRFSLAGAAKPEEAAAEYEKAEQALRKGIDLGAQESEVYFVFGQVQVALRDWEEAATVFGDLVEDEPELADAWVELALVRNKRGDLTGAEEALARAATLGTAAPKLFQNVQAALEGARARKEKKEKAGASGGGG